MIMLRNGYAHIESICLDAVYGMLSGVGPGVYHEQKN